MTTKYSLLITKNATLWQTCSIVTVRQGEVRSVALRLIASKAVYQIISKATGVPWWAIAVIHEREASGNFNCSLAQGDPWTKPSIHRPRHRGPFTSFVAAAEDALVGCPPFAARWSDWSPGGALTLLELYNGTGYEAHGEPSPYLWSATNHEARGKFTSDGHYSPQAWDNQLGCAAILITIAQGCADVREALYPKPPTLPETANGVHPS